MGPTKTAAGIGATELARRLGCTASALRVLVRHGHVVPLADRPGRPPRYSPESVPALRAWLAARRVPPGLLPTPAVARQLGYHTTTVLRQCARLGIQPDWQSPPPGLHHCYWHPDRLPELAAALAVDFQTADYLTTKQAARRANCCSHVVLLLRRRGLLPPSELSRRPNPTYQWHRDHWDALFAVLRQHSRRHAQPTRRADVVRGERVAALLQLAGPIARARGQGGAQELALELGLSRSYFQVQRHRTGGTIYDHVLYILQRLATFYGLTAARPARRRPAA